MPDPKRLGTMRRKHPKEEGEWALSETPLSRKELLRDSLATLREAAGFLDESLELQASEPKGSRRTSVAFPISPGSTDMAEFLRDTHSGIQELQEDIGAINTPPCHRFEALPRSRVRS